MSSLSSSFECSISSKQKSIPLKTWEECKTLPEKFGFVVGRIIPSCCSKISNGIKSAVKCTRLDKGAQHCQNAAKSLFSCFRSCQEKTNRCCQPILVRIPSCRVKTLRSRVHVPEKLNNCCFNIVKTMGRICKTISENCSISCDKLSKLIRPCFTCADNTESRVDRACHDLLGKCCTSLCKRISKCSSSLCDPFAKLFKDYIATPASEFIDGFAGGCCGKREVPVQEIELDDVVRNQDSVDADDQKTLEAFSTLDTTEMSMALAKGYLTLLDAPRADINKIEDCKKELRITWTHNKKDYEYIYYSPSKYFVDNPHNIYCKSSSSNVWGPRHLDIPLTHEQLAQLK